MTTVNSWDGQLLIPEKEGIYIPIPVYFCCPPTGSGCGTNFQRSVRFTRNNNALRIVVVEQHGMNTALSEVHTAPGRRKKDFGGSPRLIVHQHGDSLGRGCSGMVVRSPLETNVHHLRFKAAVSEPEVYFCLIGCVLSHCHHSSTCNIQQEKYNYLVHQSLPLLIQSQTIHREMYLAR